MQNKVTAKMLRKAAKILDRKLEVEKPYYVEVENPKIKEDFLGGNNAKSNGKLC